MSIVHEKKVTLEEGIESPNDKSMDNKNNMPKFPQLDSNLLIKINFILI